MKEEFIQAIKNKQKIKVTFLSQKDEAYTTRTCAPLDYCPGRNIYDKVNRYWVWDYDGSNHPHQIPLKEENIKEMTILQEYFNPKEFVTWKPNWIIPRDWGDYS